MDIKLFTEVDGELAESERGELRQILQNPVFRKAAKMILAEADDKARMIAHANLATEEARHDAVRNQGRFQGAYSTFETLLTMAEEN